MRKPRLTIGIPTYNRPKMLARSLECIFQQATPECSILVIDNHSEPSVEPIFTQIAQKYPAIFARYIRNPSNIGGDANFLRVFEHADGEWLWLFGDDDIPKPGAIASILAACAAYPHAGALSFHVEDFKTAKTKNLPGPVEAHSLRDALEHVGLFSLSLISASIYNVPKMRPFLRIGYFTLHTRFAHLALVIAYLKTKPSTIVGFPYPIVTFTLDGHEEVTWSFRLLERCLLLSDLIEEETALSAFARCDLVQHIDKFLSERRLVPDAMDLMLAQSASQPLALRRLYERTMKRGVSYSVGRRPRAIGFHALKMGVLIALSSALGILLLPLLRGLYVLFPGFKRRVATRLDRVGGWAES